MNKSNYVWYVCYGSNLSYERFMKYINKCKDKTEPLSREPIIIPYKIYFAGITKTWGNGGKCFLDIEQTGLTYGAKYLITQNQFNEVKKQEGRDYCYKVNLGFDDKYGIPQYTFTESNHRTLAKNVPSEKYINVIKDGLKENHKLSDEDIDSYLKEAINN